MRKEQKQERSLTPPAPYSSPITYHITGNTIQETYVFRLVSINNTVKND